VRVLSVPWQHGDETVGVTQLARPMGEFDSLWRRLLRAALVLLPVTLLVAVAGGLALTERALRPVAQVTRAAAELGAEDLGRRLPVAGDDELAELARTFNAMLARLQAAFEQQRRFTADSSHELRTPLARVKLATSMALGGPPSLDEYREALTVADRGANAMNKLIDQLLALARADAGQLVLEVEPLAVAEVLANSLDAIAPAAAARVTLVPPPADLRLLADHDSLTRVLVNLLDNALRHTPPEGHVTLSAAAAGERVAIMVADDGEGIAPEHLPHLAERFYRADAARSRRAGGSGLGLAIVASLLATQEGELHLDSEPGRGTRATVSLPAA